MRRVHEICSYLRKVRDEDGICKQCPAWRPSPYGRAKPICYALAQEMQRVVLTGTPFKKRHKKVQP